MTDKRIDNPSELQKMFSGGIHWNLKHKRTLFSQVANEKKGKYRLVYNIGNFSI